MRLEGIKASKRSKVKYEKFEQNIKELKIKMAEKDRKLRKYNENDNKIKKMESELDEKYRTIKRLRKDLASADVEIDEWKDAYEAEKEIADREREAYDDLNDKYKELEKERDNYN